MTINKNANGALTTLEIIGRLDTTTAPELDAAIDSCLPDTQALVLDFHGLEYISSAGLRVLLSSQKVMNRQGTMKLIHVREEVQEIFEVTGFLDILTVE